MEVENMRELFESLEPRKAMTFFYEISQIPRGSGHELEISRYLEKFAKERGLKHHKDPLNNVWIRKEAHPEKKDRPGVILQGHMDMVWEKNQDRVFDFLKEPIPLVLEGDILRADGTTLGADNGIGVALALALLDDTTHKLPLLEGVFTVDEERGLTGALAFDATPLKGRILINLDSEDDDEILTSCAGGVRINYHMPVERKALPEGMLRCKITVEGLKGGHSGMDINKGRGNANHLMGRVLYALNEEMQIALEDVHGGAKDNAIPRESYTLLYAESGERENLELTVQSFQRKASKEYAKNDEEIRIRWEWLSEVGERPMDSNSTQKVIALLLNIPNGVHSMSEELEGLPVSSQNLGVVETFYDSVQFSVAARSSSQSKKEELLAINQSLGRQFGARMEKTGDYPGWSYARDSRIRDLAVAVYERRFGTKPKVVAVHAGVECGIFGDKIPGLDMISVGPNIRDVHSPREQLSLSSTRKTWSFLVDLLESI